MNKYDDVKMNANVNMKSIDDIDDIDDIKSTTKIEPVPFKELFRFYKTEDIVMLLTGCVFAAIGGL